ncbi:MAG: ATP synthase F0 subunit C [Elusimicrobia bacterium]|nr:ATP synthase F0 subunit C [Elusimicrobiota bacterium]MBU2614974.1 ATP synthase F0 subunit C [Elusimicrobiota bacterium]
MFRRIISVCSFMLMTGLVFAQEKAATAVVQAAAPFSVNYFVWTVIVSGLGIAFAAAFCGLAQSMVVSKAVEGISRQPEATPQIQLAMMIGLAFIESLVLYTLFIGIILLFVNPFMKYFIQ